MGRWVEIGAYGSLANQMKREKEMLAQANNLSHLAHHEVMEFYDLELKPPI